VKKKTDIRCRDNSNNNSSKRHDGVEEDQETTIQHVVSLKDTRSSAWCPRSRFTSSWMRSPPRGFDRDPAWRDGADHRPSTRECRSSALPTSHSPRVRGVVFVIVDLNDAAYNTYVVDSWIIVFCGCTKPTTNFLMPFFRKVESTLRMNE
jgi:hypothetical protein